MSINKTYYKQVLLPITVTAGDYCWGKDNGEIRRICGHFDCQSGPTCDLNMDALEPLKFNEYGEVHKPKRCLELQEVR